MRKTMLGLWLTAAACGGGGSTDSAGQTPPSTMAVQGTWKRPCRTVAGHDFTETLTFSGLNLTVSSGSWNSSDGSCTGQPLRLAGLGTTFTLGAESSATLSNAPVNAQELTENYDPTPTYTIVRVDATASPALLYVGDLSATAGLDGTAPAKRPTVLDPWAHQKQ